MNDIDRIIDYMYIHRSITCKECEKHIGTTELRKRICDIKDRGYEIGDVWETGENRYGVQTRYKRYFIIKAPDEPKKPVCVHPPKMPRKDKTLWDFFGGIYNLTRKIKGTKMKHQQKEEKQK